MRFKPNLSKVWRVIYAVTGLVLVVAPFATGAAGWERMVLPVLGALSIATAATGW